MEASLNSLGNLAGSRKDFETAEHYHRQALRLGETLAPDRVGDLLINLGEDERLQGRYNEAEQFLNRALSLNGRLPLDSDRSIAVANTLISLAAVARDRGDLVAAEQLERRALALREAFEPGTFHLAEDREVLADILRRSGKDAEAREVYNQIRHTVSKVAPGSELEARTIHAIGDLDRRAGRAANAETAFRQAIDTLEAQEGRLGHAQDTREQFSAAYSDYYRDLVDTLVDVSRFDEAFWVLERSHARFLLEMLATRDIAFSSDIPESLEEERRRVNATYEAVQGELQELSAQEFSQRGQEMLDRLAELREGRRAIADKISALSGRYSSLRYPRPLDRAASATVLDSGTLLLSYCVAQSRTLLFVLEPATTNRGDLHVFTIPKGERALRESVEAYRTLLDPRSATRPGNSARFIERSRSLYGTLLKQAEPAIARYDRILILPDGPLHILPWAALVRGMKDGKPQYLVEWRPIHTAVSATVYADLKKSRHENRRAPIYEIAAFGDPKYPQLAKPASSKRGHGSRATDSLSDDLISDPYVRGFARGGNRFDPLPRSREEVQSITALYAPKSETFLGEDATEERAKSLGKDIPLIHFACHAYVNERFPLDSALVFSIPEHPKEGQDNGLLQAWEIFEQVRIDADLVTLSACDSGLGKEMGGEGLIGLTRAFQYAGARSILASLWKVEDTSTAELMKRFYGYLKAGKHKDEALRLAQIDLIHSPAFSSPRDWAAFELFGDWK